MKMNKLALACGAALLATSAVAQAEFSANIGVTSNYVWRGMTQTSDGAAIQGGIDYSHESGFYAGTWASNVDGGTQYGTYEVDGYLGFGGEVSGIGYDIGYIYYAYPAGQDGNFGEVYGSASFSMFTVGAAYVTNNDGGDDGDLYYYGSASFDLPQDFSLTGTVGQYDSDDAAVDGYTHYQLDIGKSVGDFGDFTFSVSANDVSDSDPLVFVSWGKTF